MKISIIIPIYKVEKYLKRCLESVINQTYSDLQIILINDGSPDNSVEICNQYSLCDERIIIINQENMGVSFARNYGMKVAVGEYLYFIDPDDYIDHKAIEILQRRAEETKADIILGNILLINKQGSISLSKLYDKERLVEKDLKKYSVKFKSFCGDSYFGSVCNRLYKTSYVKALKINFEDTKIIYPEDILFNLKIYIRYPKIELVNDYIYYYFQRSGSLTNSQKKDLTVRYIKHLESFFCYAKQLGKLDEIEDLIAYRAFSSINGSGFNAHKYSKRRFDDMIKELKIYKNSDLINSAVSNLAKGKYIKDVPRLDWKIYCRLFSIAYKLNLLKVAVFLQMFRFILGK